MTGKTIKETLEGKGWTGADGLPQIVMVRGVEVFEPTMWSPTRADKRIPVDDIMPAGTVLFVEGGDMIATISRERGVWMTLGDGSKLELRCWMDADFIAEVRIAE